MLVDIREKTGRGEAIKEAGRPPAATGPTTIGRFKSALGLLADAAYNPARTLTVETVFSRNTLLRGGVAAHRSRDRAGRFVSVDHVARPVAKEAGHG